MGLKAGRQSVSYADNRVFGPGNWGNVGRYWWDVVKLTLDIAPAAGFTLSVDYHVMRLASDNDAWYWCNVKPMRRTPGGGAGRTVGSEIDVVARWKVNAHWELMAGYGHFFPGPYIESTGGNADHADWVFTQVTFTF